MEWEEDKVKYEWKKTVSKSWKYLCFYGIPMLIAWSLNLSPEVIGLTTGTILTGLSDWFKHRDRIEF